MNIPEQAYEAAEKAVEQYGTYRDMDDPDQVALSQEQADMIAAAVKAAAPFIAAQALRDLADDLENAGGKHFRTVYELRRRADRLEAGQ